MPVVFLISIDEKTGIINMNSIDSRFCTSNNFEKSVMKNDNFKHQYFDVLKKMMDGYGNDAYINSRLNHYKEILGVNNSRNKRDKNNDLISDILGSDHSSSLDKYKYQIITDAAGICFDERYIKEFIDKNSTSIGKINSNKLLKFTEMIFSSGNISEDYSYLKKEIDGIRANIQWLSMPLKKYAVISNVNSGKSTLINAIAGKKIMRTSSEICTQKIQYLYDKPFEDGKVNLLNKEISFNTTEKDTEMNVCDMAASFMFFSENKKIRSVFADTPGINNSLNKEYRKIVEDNVISSETDKIICVLDSGKIGTEDEDNFVKWVSDKTDHNKIVFVLNKLDNYNIEDDDISESVVKVQKWLKKRGISDPVLCPVSAYFGYLIKQMVKKEKLNFYENNYFRINAERFKCPSYDLSGFYDSSSDNENQLADLYIRSGMYGMENILFGG